VIEWTEQEYFTKHVHMGLGLKLSNSSQMTLNFVKYSITNKSLGLKKLLLIEDKKS